MRYETRTTDNRADYYAGIAELIAADPLDFYARAERGRRWQALNLTNEYAAEQMGTAEPTEYDYA